MAELRRADTALAEWLAHAMARWINPQTQMPGISQRRLAEETGVSQTQLHAIIKKGHSPGPEKNPGNEKVNRIALVYNVVFPSLLQVCWKPDQFLRYR